MRLFSRRPSKVRPSPKVQAARRRARLQFDILENRVCPSTLSANLDLSGNLIITQTSPGFTNLMIFGDTAPGTANSNVTVAGVGFGTTVNGMNQVPFHLMFPGSLASIQVILGNGGSEVSVGQDSTHVLWLPGTPLSVGFAPGAAGGTINFLQVGSPSAAVANKLGNITWTTPPAGSGQDVVALFDSSSAGLSITEGNHANDIVALEGAGPTFTSITQGGGANDVIISEAFSVGPFVPSALGVTKIIQGSGDSDIVVLNYTSTQSLSIVQGNGNGDLIGIGFDSSLGALPFNVTTAGTTIFQGSGTHDVVVFESLDDTVGTSITQQDASGNASGDDVFQVFNHLAGGDASLASLSVTQGGAAGDFVALAQLGLDTGSHTLAITGGLSVTQQGIAGNNSDVLIIGSYTPATPPAGSTPPTPPYTPPVVPTSTGNVVAFTLATTQGNANGDFLYVVFTTTTSPVSGAGFNMTQGNGVGDAAIFQRDVATQGFFFTGGTGSGLYVQADSNTAAVGQITANGSFATFANDLKNSGIVNLGFAAVVLG
jgi:hypothetical protein